MPYCRQCHQEISKFDTDICPHCGEPNPIAEGYQTMDVTKAFTTMGEELVMPKTRKQKTFALLCMLLGYFGVHNFYIYRYQRGVVSILVTLLIVCGIGMPLFFTGLLPNAFAFVLPFLGWWLVHVIFGIYYAKVESPKDGRGEFLR